MTHRMAVAIKSFAFGLSFSILSVFSNIVAHELALRWWYLAILDPLIVGAAAGAVFYIRNRYRWQDKEYVMSRDLEVRDCLQILALANDEQLQQKTLHKLTAILHGQRLLQ